MIIPDYRGIILSAKETVNAFARFSLPPGDFLSDGF